MSHYVTSSSSSSGVAWNGPICGTCNARYLGHHTCSRTDICQRVTELLQLLARLDRANTEDLTAGCPCRTENGGSGVCGCVLSGPKIT